jgi:voltage-gated potassium channel
VSVQTRAEQYDAYRERSQLLLVGVNVALILMLMLRIALHLPSGVTTAFTAADYVLCVVLAVDFLVGLRLAPDPKRFVRREWLVLLLVAVPVFHPIRFLRSAHTVGILIASRIAAGLARAAQLIRPILVGHPLRYAASAAAAVVVGSATLVWAVEHDAGGPIQGYGDALWWSATTVTTVGYGDTYPTTNAGRLIAVFLMLGGIALFGFVTASLAAFLVQRGFKSKSSTDARLDEVIRRMRLLERELTELRRRV